MSSEEIYSVVSAAKLTGYSVPTIRKRLDVLAKAGAVQDDRQWKIPLAALHVAGLMKKVEEQTFRSVSSESLQGSTVTTMQALQGQLNEALRRAEVAEAVAAERLTALERADRAGLLRLQREAVTVSHATHSRSRSNSHALRRWESASFSAAVISPNVRLSPFGTKIASQPKPL